MSKSYLMGGKLGDFIHGLVVCKRIYENTREKADLYISNIGDSFERSLEFTYNELKPILEKQEWLNSFNIHNGEFIDVCLNDFRNSPHLYNTNWINIYFKTFLNGEEPPKEYKWIELSKNPIFKNSLVVNRSINRYGPIPFEVKERYKKIMFAYKEKYFVCFDKSQYDNFEFKSEFDLILVDNLYEYFEIINSSKLFIGNQTGPYAWASAMNVPRVLEIMKSGNQLLVDGVHYFSDSQYYKNFSII